MTPDGDIAKRVLLVDDDQATLSGLTELLRGAGFDVVPCRSFSEARVFVLAGPIATLLTDVRLGDHNGLHLIQLVRSKHPRARVIAFTGFDDLVLRRDAEALGATFMVKPFDVAALLDLLEPHAFIPVESRPLRSSPR